ncbi:MAG: secretin and TonB N-terminal domain-containing protein [Candidatus Omnitrophica bacterium]|nr:secretin and TonB N-terminal domain-containing protein [Candidatus Omnitrophota bacterium]
MMRKSLRKVLSAFFCCVFLIFTSPLPAQEPAAPEPAERERVAASARDVVTVSDNVTLDFKDADIRNVLKILSQKSGVNIVPTPDVMGTVTIKLVEVPWDRALDVILKSNNFGFQKQGNVILVTKVENMSKIQSEEPLRTEIVNLKFLDALDAQRIIIPMLSARGKISVLYSRGQKGWKFGTFKIGREEASTRMLEREAEVTKTEPISVERTAAGGYATTKIEQERSIKSKTLMITDTDSILDRIVNDVLPKVDKPPKQVLIEARIMEVNIDKLRDIGFDYGTGTSGGSSTTVTGVKVNSTTLGGNVLGTVDSLSPSNFNPKATSIDPYQPFNAGLNLVFEKLSGAQFEVVMHALEEDVHANTLSAPRVMTLDNQEAAMFVGYYTPILKTDLSNEGNSTTVIQNYDYYQEIGIRLHVVPQVSDDGYINMIIHPSITSSTTNVTATITTTPATGAPTSTETDYPVIDAREVQTQIMMKDGETVVIGGLLKDTKTKGTIGVPFLSKLPLVGALFRRETVDNGKIDLLIFITAHVVSDDEFSSEAISRLEKRLNTIDDKPEAIEKKKKGQPVQPAAK